MLMVWRFLLEIAAGLVLGFPEMRQTPLLLCLDSLEADLSALLRVATQNVHR